MSFELPFFPVAYWPSKGFGCVASLIVSPGLLKEVGFLKAHGTKSAAGTSMPLDAAPPNSATRFASAPDDGGQSSRLDGGAVVGGTIWIWVLPTRTNCTPGWVVLHA